MIARTVGALAAALLLAGCGSSGDNDSAGTPPMATPTELVAIDAFLSNLVVDESALYFQAEGGIRTLPLGAADHVELASTTGETMVDDGEVLWITRGSSGAGQIIRIAKSDGSQEVIVADQLAPNSIAVDNTHVFWTNASTYQSDPPDGSVMMARKDGTQVTELAGGLENPGNVAINIGQVFFSTGVDDATISFVMKDASRLESVVTGQVWPKALIVEGSTLYWFNDVAGSSTGGETSAIMRHDVLLGETEVLYEDSIRPHDLALDGEDLYWTGQNMGDCNTNPDYVDGVVRSIPAAGGSVRTLASKLLDANDLVVRGDTLYFARSLSGCGAIFSLPKRQQ